MNMRYVARNIVARKAGTEFRWFVILLREIVTRLRPGLTHSHKFDASAARQTINVTGYRIQRLGL
jgi:hypothetical protein